MSDTDRTVSFTVDEAQSIAEFLRTFEASPVALRLLGVVTSRTLDSLADAIEAVPAKADPVLPPISDKAWDLLSYIAANEKTSFDQHIRPFDLPNNRGPISRLYSLGYIEQKLGTPDLYRTTPGGRRALVIRNNKEKNS